MNNKKKNYSIKVPVYVTEIVEDAAGLFGGVSFEDMQNYIRNRCKDYLEHKPAISFDNQNKTKKTVINNLEVNEIDMGSQMGFLIKISAFTTNLYDGYFEAKEKIKFSRDNKIGSDNNYFLIYPQIKGVERDKYQCYFIVMLYEDPHKTNEDIVKISKLALKKIFKIPIRNIKLPTLLEELRTYKRAQEFQIKFTAVDFNDNDVELVYRDFLVAGTMKRQKIRKYKNIPISLVEEIIMDDNTSEYDKMESKIIQGKKEYKITRELLEAKENLNETAEKIFNASSAISEIELEEKIYSQDFIISKLQPVLENYLSSSDES